MAHGPAIIIRWPPPTLTPLMSNDRVVGVELAAGELERLEDRHDLLDAGDRLERLDLELLLVADHADDRPRDPLAEVGREAQLLDPLEHVLDLLGRRVRLQHDDHRRVVLSSGCVLAWRASRSKESKIVAEPAGARSGNLDPRRVFRPDRVSDRAEPSFRRSRGDRSAAPRPSADAAERPGMHSAAGAAERGRSPGVRIAAIPGGDRSRPAGLAATDEPERTPSSRSGCVRDGGRARRSERGRTDRNVTCTLGFGRRLVGTRERPDPRASGPDTAPRSSRATVNCLGLVALRSTPRRARSGEGAPDRSVCARCSPRSGCERRQFIEAT